MHSILVLLLLLLNSGIAANEALCVLIPSETIS